MHCIMEFVLNPLLPLSGFAVGVLVGLTGVGGGSLMTPLLVLLFGFKPATAVGTDLLYAAITKAGGSWVHQRHGNIDWAITGRLALGSVPAAALTLLLLKLLDVNSVANLFATNDGRFCKFLTVTQFFNNTGFFEFTFQFLQRAVNAFAFFYRNNDHNG